MAITLTIKNDICTRCGKCVKVCPSKIFKFEPHAPAVEIINIDSCIVCGHCAAVCPVGAVVHNEFPTQKVHHIDYSQIPQPEQMMLLCKARRSNRAFSAKPIPAESLEMILEAAHRAPTASNSQQMRYTVVTDPEMLRMIVDSTMEVFGQMLKKLKNPLLKPLIKMAMPDAPRYVHIFERMQREHAKGVDNVLRNATAVILIHTPKTNKFGSADANMAYQNGSLMAECLGVSQFYTGFVLSAVMQDKQHRLARALGIDGHIQAGMALGMPQFRFPNYIDRRDMVVDRK